MKTLCCVGAVLACVFFAHSGWSEESKHDCAAAAYEGQSLRDSGDFVSARAKFLQCVAPACPALVVSDCTAWLAQIDQRLPTIVLAAHDVRGNDLVGVRVTMDGRPLAATLNGKSVAVNPGPHQLTFVDTSGASVEATIVAREGEKSRIVSVTFPPSSSADHPAPAATQAVAPSVPANTPATPPSAPPPPAQPGPAPPSTGVSLGAILAGSLGGASLVTFAVFGIKGQIDKNKLSDTCASTHTCSTASVNSARAELIVADVALGVGVVAVAAATYLLLSHRTATGHHGAVVTPASPLNVSGGSLSWTF